MFFQKLKYYNPWLRKKIPFKSTLTTKMNDSNLMIWAPIVFFTDYNSTFFVVFGLFSYECLCHQKHDKQSIKPTLIAKKNLTPKLTNSHLG